MRPTQHDVMREFGDKYIAAAKRVLSSIYPGAKIVVSNEKMDMKEATDLIIFEATDPLFKSVLKIAFRVRRFKFWVDFQQEFTIRSKVKAGGPTEIDKISQGYGDFLLYAFALSDLDDHEFFYWRLLDLDVFRDGLRNDVVSTEKLNTYPNGEPDGSALRIYQLENFPRGLVVARGAGIPDPRGAPPEVEQPFLFGGL